METGFDEEKDMPIKNSYLPRQRNCDLVREERKREQQQNHKMNKSLINVRSFYDVPMGRCGGPSSRIPPMTVMCLGLKGVKSVGNYPNNCSILINTD